MNQNLGKWLLSILGVASVAFSFVLLFSTVAKATCSVTVNCPAGSPRSSVECGGDQCFGLSDSVSCYTGTCNTVRSCRDKVIPPACNGE